LVHKLGFLLALARASNVALPKPQKNPSLLHQAIATIWAKTPA